MINNFYLYNLSSATTLYNRQSLSWVTAQKYDLPTKEFLRVHEIFETSVNTFKIEPVTGKYLIPDDQVSLPNQFGQCTLCSNAAGGVFHDRNWYLEP